MKVAAKHSCSERIHKGRQGDEAVPALKTAETNIALFAVSGAA